jgi:ferredoxin
MIKKVTIEPGCISCGSCQFLAPAVFEVTDMSHVKEGIDFEQYRASICNAAAKCPVQVIRVEE